MKRKCICEICTCGRHHCPHNPTQIFDKGGQACRLSEYVEKYPLYGNIQPAQSLKPKQEYQRDHGKMEGMTTFKSDYMPYDAINRPVRVQEVYQPKPGQIDLGTTYKRDFNPYEVAPMVPARPVERRQTHGGKVDTTPTYKDDYRPWDIQKRELTKPDHSYNRPTVKFGNSTTFQDDFIPKGVEPRESYKPSAMAKLSKVPFDGVTSHRISYIPYEIEPKHARQKQEYKPSSQPFDDLTTHRLDFKGLLGGIAKSCKPEYSKVGSNAAFNGSTEFRDRFQPWSISLPQVRKMAEYVPPEVQMELDTTSHMAYIKHHLSPVAPIRPMSQGRRVKVPFKGNTTMKEDFRAWETGRQEIVKRDQQIQRPSGKFEGLTTFQSHYIPHEMNPTHSFKPMNAPLQSLVPFEGGTMYRSDYTPKKNEICPANYPAPPGYVFESVDERGHKFFRKASPPEISNMALHNGNYAPKEVMVMS
ncbi:stabilizer of axonemal microtubules 2 [Ambystoma mexicanum]|uniref:stabilizer of axonemal microtubules 2 n=1 Tax=Ambystoma mexicanum TaxID=8296 RepID=UPI0037E7FCD3